MKIITCCYGEYKEFPTYNSSINRFTVYWRTEKDMGFKIHIKIHIKKASHLA